MNQKRIADLESRVRLPLAWLHAWRTWQLPHPGKYINKLCFIFHIISHGLTFWNTQLKSSNKRALLEKIMHCVTCASLAWLVTYQTVKKARNIARADIPCVTNVFRIQIFENFTGFSRSTKNVPAKKIIPSKNYSIVEIYIQTLPFTCLFRSKIKRN